MSQLWIHNGIYPTIENNMQKRFNRRAKIQSSYLKPMQIRKNLL